MAAPARCGAVPISERRPADGAKYGYSASDVRTLQAREAQIEARIDAEVLRQATHFRSLSATH